MTSFAAGFSDGVPAPSRTVSGYSIGIAELHDERVRRREPELNGLCWQSNRVVED
jgi:hypothetical protein